MNNKYNIKRQQVYFIEKDCHLRGVPQNYFLNASCNSSKIKFQNNSDINVLALNSVLSTYIQHGLC